MSDPKSRRRAGTAPQAAVAVTFVSAPVFAFRAASRAPAAAFVQAASYGMSASPRYAHVPVRSGARTSSSNFAAA